MATKRMFSLDIVDSDSFLELPPTSQNLYFHLAMRSDDDGFNNKPKAVMNMVHATDDDMKLLIAKRFVIAFDTGVIVIKHWNIHNYIRKDTYKETKYKIEKGSLYIDENGCYSKNYQPDTIPSRTCNGLVTDSTHSIDKNRLDKSRLDKIRIDQSITEVLTDDDFDKLDKRYEDILGLIDFVDNKIHLSSKPVEIFNALAYVVAIAEKERWQTR